MTHKLIHTVVITGANRGIGLALAQRYLKRGSRVVALCRSKTGSQLQLEALKTIIVKGDVDVTDFPSLKGAVCELTEKHGIKKVDLLINNAGIMMRDHWGHGGGWDEESFLRMTRTFEVNGLGPLKVTTAFSPLLKRGAKVGMITSRMGSMGDNSSGGSYGYRMSKAALNMASTSLAYDLREKGIAIAILHPGWVRTDMTKGKGHLDPEEAAQNLVERMDQLTMENTGTFWHSHGKVLPW